MKESYKERYSKKERCIFRYFNGEKEVATDPMAAQRKLIGAAVKDFHFDTDAKLMSLETPNAETVAALGRMLEATRLVFKVAPFSEDDEGNQHGLTDDEVLALFYDFAVYVENLKKKHEPTQTSVNSTVPESSAEDPASVSMQGSTSTVTAQASVAPASPMEPSVPPSEA